MTESAAEPARRDVDPTRTRRLRGLRISVASLAACAAVSGTASAAYFDENNGDILGTRYFPSQAYIYGPDGETALQEGIYYTSNFGPRGLTAVNVSGRPLFGGALMNATARSEPNGFFSSRNLATLTVFGVQDTDFYSAEAGYGSRSQVTFFSPASLATRANVKFKVTGSQSAPENTTAFSRLDFLSRPNTGDASFNDLFSVGQRFDGEGEFSYTMNATQILGVPIDMFYWSAAVASIFPGQATQGSTTTVFANYGNTYEMVGLDLFDANDNAIQQWTMVDTSTGLTMFDQNGRYVPPAQVPAPGGLALLGLGLLGLLAARRTAARAAIAAT